MENKNAADGLELRELVPAEYGEALLLARRVFMQYEAPEYSEAGAAAFMRALESSEYVDSLRIYGAFLGERLIGILALREHGAHIALFFVESDLQGKGIGRRLFDFVFDGRRGKITVNSSPYAVGIYESLGFSADSEEQISDGIRYIPMSTERE